MSNMRFGPFFMLQKENKVWYIHCILQQHNIYHTIDSKKLVKNWRKHIWQNLCGFTFQDSFSIGSFDFTHKTIGMRKPKEKNEYLELLKIHAYELVIKVLIRSTNILYIHIWYILLHIHKLSDLHTYIPYKTYSLYNSVIIDYCS